MNVEEFEKGKKEFLKFESIFKSQQAQIADLTKRVNDLEQEGSYFKRAENIKEARRLM